ncbi:hypothetical protein [Terrilactibacillus laevilacticus]|uniref:Uncharacterized protein n=1 Tax=Terrilactibacillus laevilacticus TaxID=1380157 RepID=A0ABW5PUL4_9BACI|nr:hypothetical protein [Terrilactibacillus laevilacticus]
MTLQNQNKLPWYLKDKPFFFLALLLPVISYIIIVCNRKKLRHQKSIEYLTLSTITTSIWLLKFLPETVNTFVWAIIASSLIGHSVVGIFIKK